MECCWAETKAWLGWPTHLFTFFVDGLILDNYNCLLKSATRADTKFFSSFVRIGRSVNRVHAGSE